MVKDIENVKIAIVLRMARNALDINQEYLAEQIGTCKSNIARIETLQSGARADTFNKALVFFKNKGVHISFDDDNINIKIDPQAFKCAENNIELRKQLRR